MTDNSMSLPILGYYSIRTAPKTILKQRMSDLGMANGGYFSLLSLTSIIISGFSCSHILLINCPWELSITYTLPHWKKRMSCIFLQASMSPDEYLGYILLPPTLQRNSAPMFSNCDCTDEEYMRNFADRYKIYSGVDMQYSNADEFLSILIETGYIERIE